MTRSTHGLVHDDLRHLSRLEVAVDGAARSRSWPRAARRRCRRWSWPRPTPGDGARAGGRARPAAAGWPAGCARTSTSTTRRRRRSDLDVRVRLGRRLRPRLRREGRPVGARAHSGDRRGRLGDHPAGPTRRISRRARLRPGPTTSIPSGRSCGTCRSRPVGAAPSCLTVEPVVRRRPGRPGVPVRGGAGRRRSRCAGSRRGGRAVPTRGRRPIRGSRSVVDQALADIAAPADHRPGPPRPGRDRRRRALVHDPVRARLAAHVVDDCCRSTPSSPRGAREPGRTAGHGRRPGRGGAAGQDPPRAAPPRRRRPVRRPRALLRHRRRHAAVRHARRRGVAVGRPRDDGPRRPRARPSTPRSTGCSAPATPTATGSSTTSGRDPSGSRTRAGRTRGTA